MPHAPVFPSRSCLPCFLRTFEAMVDIILAVSFERTWPQDHEAEVDKTNYAISGVSGVRGGE